MRNPQGYVQIVEPGKADVERDTISCGHCNMIVIVAPLQDPTTLGGFCRQCMKHICAKCTDDPTCIPLMKRIDEMEKRGRMFQSLGL